MWRVPDNGGEEKRREEKRRGCVPVSVIEARRLFAQFTLVIPSVAATATITATITATTITNLVYSPLGILSALPRGSTAADLPAEM